MKLGNAINKAIEERLVSGERVILKADIHWGIFWKAAAVALLAVLIGMFIAHELGVFLGFVAIISAIYAFLKRQVLLLVLTDKRILARYGLLQVDVVDIHFDKIESIELERMPTAYLMGYSHVSILGTGQKHIVIPYVANGPEFRRLYNEQVLAKK